MGAFVLLSESSLDPGNLGVWKLSWLRQSKQEPWNSWEQSHVYLCLLWIWECQTPLLPKKQIQSWWRKLFLHWEVSRSRSVCGGSFKNIWFQEKPGFLLGNYHFQPDPYLLLPAGGVSTSIFPQLSSGMSCWGGYFSLECEDVQEFHQ